MNSATALLADAPAHRDAQDVHTPLAAVHAAETTIAAASVVRDPRQAAHKVQEVTSRTEVAAEERLARQKTRTT